MRVVKGIAIVGLLALLVVTVGAVGLLAVITARALPQESGTTRVRLARRYLARRFPDLADAPVVETRVCQYETTPDSHFVIDRHPALDNVWLVGGGSGHGFKHGPVIGRHVVGRLDGRPWRPARNASGSGTSGFSRPRCGPAPTAWSRAGRTGSAAGFMTPAALLGAARPPSGRPPAEPVSR